MDLTTMLLVINGMTITLVLGGVLLVLMYRTIFKHECQITVIRQGNRQVKKSRWRIKKDKEKNEIMQISPLQGGYKLPKPHESFFGVITKKRLYADIVIPDNGEPYCIKPNFDNIGKIIKFDIDDRDVKAACKQELRAGVQKYMFKSNMAGAVGFLAIIALILISLLNGFWLQRTFQSGMAEYRDMRNADRNATLELASALKGFNAYVDIIEGSRNNPLPIRTDTVGGTG